MGEWTRQGHTWTRRDSNGKLLRVQFSRPHRGPNRKRRRR